MPASPFSAGLPYVHVSAWLRNPYVQLYLAEWMARRERVRAAPKLFELCLPGGARTRMLVFDPLASARGVLVLIHGLGGAADSPHTLRLAAEAASRGFKVAAVDMRGAGGRLTHSRLYTAADLDEIDAALAHPAVATATGPKVLCGLSLGGGIVTRWLGMRGSSAPVTAAVALGPTIDLRACAHALSRRRHFFFDWSFARALGRRIRAAAPGSGRRKHGWLAHRTMRRLDDSFASLACGKDDAESYWDHASAHHHLAGLARPLMVVAAADDPFVPVEPLRRHVGAHPLVDLRVFEHGGHLSFLEVREGRLRSALPRLFLDPLEALLLPAS